MLKIDFKQMLWEKGDIAIRHKKRQGEVCMTVLKWSEEVNINIQELDEQHKKMLVLANRVFDVNKSYDSEALVEKAFDDLMTFTTAHFGREEELMDRYRYPEHIDHKTEHNRLIQKVKSIMYLYSMGDKNVVSRLASILDDWLMTHISKNDKKLAEYLNDNGVM